MARKAGIAVLLCLMCTMGAQAQLIAPGSMVVTRTVKQVKGLLNALGLSSLTDTITQLQDDLEPLIGYTCLISKIDNAVEQVAALKLDKTLTSVNQALNCIPGTMTYQDIVVATGSGPIKMPTGVDGCYMVVSKAAPPADWVTGVTSTCKSCHSTGVSQAYDTDIVTNVCKTVGMGAQSGTLLDGLLKGLLGGGLGSLGGGGGLLDLNNLLGGLLGGNGNGGLLDSLLNTVTDLLNGLLGGPNGGLLGGLLGGNGGAGLLDGLIGPNGLLGGLLGGGNGGGLLGGGLLDSLLGSNGLVGGLLGGGSGGLLGGGLLDGILGQNGLVGGLLGGNGGLLNGLLGGNGGLLNGLLGGNGGLLNGLLGGNGGLLNGVLGGNGLLGGLLGGGASAQVYTPVTQQAYKIRKLQALDSLLGNTLNTVTNVANNLPLVSNLVGGTLGGNSGSKGILDSLLGKDGLLGGLLHSLLAPGGLVGVKDGRLVSTIDPSQVAGLSVTYVCDPVKTVVPTTVTKAPTRVVATVNNVANFAGQQFKYISSKSGGACNFIITETSSSPAKTMAEAGLHKVAVQNTCRLYNW